MYIRDGIIRLIGAEQNFGSMRNQRFVMYSVVDVTALDDAGQRKTMARRVSADRPWDKRADAPFAVRAR